MADGPKAGRYDYIVVGSRLRRIRGRPSPVRKGFPRPRGRWVSAGVAKLPKTNWRLRKAFSGCRASVATASSGSPHLRDVLVLHGIGVGGGTWCMPTPLMVPNRQALQDPGWGDLNDREQTLAPHYETARRMLGVTVNPKLTPGPTRPCARSPRRWDAPGTFHPTVVRSSSVSRARRSPDPYFGGKARPDRVQLLRRCIVGCRHNAKNTLDKNYLYLAEKLRGRRSSRDARCGSSDPCRRATASTTAQHLAGLRGPADLPKPPGCGSPPEAPLGTVGCFWRASAGERSPPLEHLGN